MINKEVEKMSEWKFVGLVVMKSLNLSLTYVIHRKQFWCISEIKMSFLKWINSSTAAREVGVSTPHRRVKVYAETYRTLGITQRKTVSIGIVEVSIQTPKGSTRDCSSRLLNIEEAAETVWGSTLTYWSTMYQLTGKKWPFEAFLGLFNR